MKQSPNVVTHRTSFSGTPSKRVLQVLRGAENSIGSYSGSSSSSRSIDNSITLPPEQCLKGIETIGGVWPTVQRGHWFPNEGDVENFRNKIRFLCPADANLLEKNKKKSMYKLAIYQRDISRKLVDQEQVIKMLQDKLSLLKGMESKEWEIVVIMHKSDRSPCEIAHLLNDVDVLVTPHGFQSMLLLFMTRPSIVFEVFPYRYYKRAYGPLSNEYSIIHGGVMSPSMSWFNYFLLSNVKTQWCMESKFCRGYARNSDVKLTAHGVNQLMVLVQRLINNNYNINKVDKLYG
jgi:hypothetical protein